MKKITTAIAVALLAACGADSEPATNTTSTTVKSTTVATTTSTAAAEPIEPAASSMLETALTEDLLYHAGDEPFIGKSGMVDVIAPTEDGDWPTVVVFHGDPRSASKTWHRSDAKMIAEQGRVVFLPAWGHVDPAAVSDLGAEAVWDLDVREMKCAVAYAKAHTADYGGDPDNITLYGLSAGGNAVVMAGMADADPLDTCTAPGPAVDVQAMVPVDADWFLGGGWDAQLTENPDAFYSITPWRDLDLTPDIPVHVLVAEIVGGYKRSVGDDPASSWLSYRHPDIDLVAGLTESGLLADGEFDSRESGEYAVQLLTEAGYDATLTVMPGARHASWGEEGTAVVVETVIAAGENATSGTTATSTPTTVVSELTATATDVLATRLVEGYRYHDLGAPYAEKSGAIDVVAPTEGEGPWPTVVVFHGDPRFATKDWHRYDAQLIAEQGVVVFLPSWGHVDHAAAAEMSTHERWSVDTRQTTCAVVYAKAHTAEFGGDPDDITLYGYSAGGNAVLMTAFGDADPLDTCDADGPAPDVRAIVPADADWLLGGHGDTLVSADPELFYLRAPWRHLDGSQDIRIYVTVTEIPGPYTRSVEPDPAESWLSYRHVDIDLVADLDARGYLGDGDLSLRESGEYAHEILIELGYESTLTVMTGATHDSWGDEGRAIVVDTVVMAAKQ